MPIFDDNGIDFSVLPDLTDQGLEKLGVLLGHPRKLLRSIANLKGTGSNAPSVQVETAPAAPRLLGSAESRQITLMFSDLDGALFPHRPGGSARSHFGVSQVRRRDGLRFDGFVAKYMSDGVLVYFWLSPGP
jgi:hypothetical protein